MARPKTPPAKSPTRSRRMRPVPLTRVSFADGFWAQRIEINRTVTLPIEYEQCRKTGRLDAWKLTWKPGKGNAPHVFWDSDTAKWLEAAAYSLAAHPDKALRARVERLVDRIEKAQQPDGYLNIHFTVAEPDKRWANLRDCHELYCAGHLMEAAVAHFQTTGSRKLLDVLCRYADHIARTFGPRPGQKRGYPGHEEIELALVKLYRATGEKRYLDLASYFIDERGARPHYYDREAKARGDDPKTYWAKTYEYLQAHLPVREQTKVVGHAVRAMYLYSGMADVAAETAGLGAPGLPAACRRLWKDLTERRMYITGGIGPTGHNEGFSIDYDLPNETAYAETCAAIGLVFWAHRMLHLDPDARYADVMERALYNGVLSGVSLTGDRFFYANPLAAYPPAAKVARSQWFGCACCPPNLARLLASLGGYVYSEGKDEAAVHLYAAGRGELNVGGRRVELEQKTDYPWRGKVRLTVRPEAPATFTLAVRIPGWCRPSTSSGRGELVEPRGAKLAVNGRPVALAGVLRKGYARLRRVWKKGDRVDLDLPMPPQLIEAHPNVRQDARAVAIQRGPIVYCLEEADNGPRLHDLALAPAAKLKVQFDRKLLGGVPVVTATATRRDTKAWGDSLYQPAGTKTQAVPIKAVPYFTWANRGVGEMVVWIGRA